MPFPVPGSTLPPLPTPREATLLTSTAKSMDVSAISSPGLVLSVAPSACVQVVNFQNKLSNASRVVTVTNATEVAEVPAADSWGGGSMAWTDEPEGAYDGSATFTFSASNKNAIVTSVDLGGEAVFVGASANGGSTPSLVMPLPSGWEPGDLAVVAYGGNQSIQWGAAPGGWTVIAEDENTGSLANRQRVMARYLQSGDTGVAQSLASSGNMTGLIGVWRVTEPDPPAPPVDPTDPTVPPEPPVPLAGMDLSSEFNRPYFEGLASGDDDSGLGWTTGQVVLDGISYLIDRKAGTYSRQSVRPVSKQSEPRAGEDTGTDYVWRRSVESWHMGAGQVFADREESNPYEFRASKGVDPWEKFQLSLLPGVSPVAAGSNPLAVVVGGELAVVDGEAVTWRNSLSDTAPLSESLPSAALQVCSDGLHLVALGQDGKVYLKRPLIAVTAISAPSGAFSVVGAVKGRIVAGAGPTFYDLTSGTPVVVWVHPDPAWSWTCVGDGLTAIYAGGGIGDKSGVYRFRSKDDGTGLDVGIQAAQLPDGEFVRHLGYYLGYGVVGTDRGVRFASSDSQGNLVLGQVLETPKPVLCSEGQGKFIWFGWSDFDSASTGLGRMDPTRFTDPLTPAYASDLMADGQGEVTTVVTYEGLRVFTVAGPGGVGGGVWSESAELVEGGWLDTGLISWNIPDRKAGAYVMARHAALEGSIQVDVSIDNGPWALVGGSTRRGSVESPNLSLEGVSLAAVSMRARLSREPLAPETGPVLTRLEARVSPVSGRTSRFVVPLIVSEATEFRGSTTFTEPENAVEALVGMVESGRMVLYREGSRAWRVVGSEYEWKPERQTSDSDAWSGVFTLILTEVV